MMGRKNDGHVIKLGEIARRLKLAVLWSENFVLVNNAIGKIEC
jgi:hypothetical protein